jgi:hypothetical protein
MTAWDFSPEQREIIQQMIRDEFDRQFGAELPPRRQGITLEPAPLVLDIGKPISDAPAFGAGVAAGALAIEHHSV